MKSTLTIYLILISFFASAQIKDGAKIIDLSFDYSNSEGFDQVFIQPLIGVASFDSQVIYAGLAYSYQGRDFDFGLSETNLASLIVGYEKFMELNEKVFVGSFITGSYGFGTSEFSGEEKTDLNNFALSFRPRIHYFITHKWSVVASVGSLQFSRQTAKDSTGDFTTNSFSANLNSSNVFFGIRLNLNNE